MATLSKVIPPLLFAYHSLHLSPETEEEVVSPKCMEHSPCVSLRLMTAIGITCILPAAGTEVWRECVAHQSTYIWVEMEPADSEAHVSRCLGTSGGEC